MKKIIQLVYQTNRLDTLGLKVERQAQKDWQISTGKVKTSQLFIIETSLDQQALESFAKDCLQDPITQDFYINEIAQPSDYLSAIVVAKRQGVTDDLAQITAEVWNDYFEIDPLPFQFIFCSAVYYFECQLSLSELKLISKKILGNPLIHQYNFYCENRTNEIKPIVFDLTTKQLSNITIKTIDLALEDEALLSLSQQNTWALNLEELYKIKAFFENENTLDTRKKMGLSLPTDCELEILAQTWSEHCKHKEFNAVIYYENRTNSSSKIIYSLFDTYIKKATEIIQKKLENNNNNWLIKVFSDNAGVVKANDKYLFVWKVETHNSPSALDPYGGAITGILGNNRDPLGTGIGGAKLLFNTNVLCFGSPYYSEPLLKGQLHPRQILDGVVQGIADGGNKSGVPTVNGAIVFDDRYSGKPLVYCGTGALMPYQYQYRDSWCKEIAPNDRIIIIGGRVGKDGIHGATFSSVEINEYSPTSAVQIGSPITQKKMADFLEIACRNGWVKTTTDNGAGGLSSSVGELAIISNGAVVQLDKVPLKYEGLQPWEIFVSESQERMTLAVATINIKPLFALAQKMAVEISDIGFFSDNGFLDVRYLERQVAYLEMDFLHNGLPQKKMFAQWEKPNLKEPILPFFLDYNKILLQLMAHLNICSKELIIRQYDHEVKGKTILKPLMGSTQKAPQDAAVMRFDFDSWEGVAISNGILPRYGDIDAYEMSAGAFDEGIRQIISVGGRLPNTVANDGVFWSVNDNFCLPDSQYHPIHNPDGKEKLAKLVQMCEALYDMATFYDIPLTSGKDSMKNDFRAEGGKISIPPTVLYSMTAKINDVRKSISSDWKKAGDLIYLLGDTYNELGGSEFYDLYEELGANVPKVRKKEAKKLYLKIMKANELALINASHDLSDGGLAVALVEACFGNNLGINIQLNNLGGNLPLWVQLFSESHSRFVVSVAPSKQKEFELIIGKKQQFLGKVTEEKKVLVSNKKEIIIDLELKQLLDAWESGLSGII